MGTGFETVNPDGEDVRLLSFRNQVDEADFIAEHCKKLIDKGWPANEIAILYRMNAMSEPIERAFANNQVPYTVIGGRSFFDRKEIKDCISMLRFIANRKDGIAFHRCAKLLPGVGDVTIGKIENTALHENIDLLESAKQFVKTAKNGKVRRGIENVISKFNFDYEDMNVSQVMEKLIDNFDYSTLLEKEYGEDEAYNRIENVNQLLNSTAIFVEDNSSSVVDYLQNISLVTSNDRTSDEATISLMTLHAAKGLEFGIVFMIGANQDILPHSLAISDDPIEGLEEERRLCYVGMTRAKKLLYVSYCQSRRQFGKGGQVWYKKCKPSQFLKESGLQKSYERVF